MPRPVAIRVSYRTDAAFLLRLEEAIGKDPRRSDAWKREAGQMARALAQKLLTAEQERIREKKAGSKKTIQESAA